MADGLFDFLKGSLSQAEYFIEEQWSSRMIQTSVNAGVVFYILSTTELLKNVEKQLANLGLRVGKDGTRALHAVLFSVFVYYGSRFILDPLVARIHLKERHPDHCKEL